MSEFNIFIITPQGYKGHFKLITEDNTHTGDLNLMQRVGWLDAYLAENGFIGEGQKWVSLGNAPENSNSPTLTEKLAQDPSPRCPICKGELWDNRAKKSSGEYNAKSPDGKCKNKSCAGVVWRWDEGI